MHSKAACRKKAPKSTLKQICPPKKKKQPKNGRRAPFIFGTAFFPAHFSYSPVIACVGEPIFGGGQKIGQEPACPKKEKSGSPDRKLSGSVSKKRGRSKKKSPIDSPGSGSGQEGAFFAIFFFFSRVEVTSRNNLFLAALAY